MGGYMAGIIRGAVRPFFPEGREVLLPSKKTSTFRKARPIDRGPGSWPRPPSSSFPRRPLGSPTPVRPWPHLIGDPEALVAQPDDRPPTGRRKVGQTDG